MQTIHKILKSDECKVLQDCFSVIKVNHSRFKKPHSFSHSKSGNWFSTDNQKRHYVIRGNLTHIEPLVA